MLALRSWMFVPADQPRKIQKAFDLPGLDAVILDLEAGVINERKDEGRRQIASALREGGSGAIFCVRTNPVAGDGFRDDLAAAVRPGLAALMIPKVHDAAIIESLEPVLLEHEASSGMAENSVAVIAVIESARGVVHAHEIATASPRMFGLMFGAEDFALDMGFPDRDDGVPDDMIHPRSTVAVAAVAARVQSIDRIVTDVRDQDLMAGDTRQGRRLGFTGKAAIHPDQVSVVNDCFAPTASEILAAQRIISVFTDAERQGLGVVALDGKMIDRPVVERARRTLKEGTQRG